MAVGIKEEKTIQSYYHHGNDGITFRYLDKVVFLLALTKSILLIITCDHLQAEKSENGSRGRRLRNKRCGRYSAFVLLQPERRIRGT